MAVEECPIECRRYTPPRQEDGGPLCQAETMGYPSDPAAEAGFHEALEQASRELVHVSMLAVSGLQTVGGAHLRALQALADLGGAHVSRWARALDVQPSTASRLSDRLTAAGLVTRETSPTNRRATLIGLTPAGRDVLAAVARARAEAYRAVTDRMDPDDRAALLRGAAAFADAARDEEGNLAVGNRDSNAEAPDLRGSREAGDRGIAGTA